MANIFILEDQKDSFAIINQSIDSSHDVIWAQSVSEAKEKFSREIDLALVDIGLPDGDGFEFCSWVRQKDEFKMIPIVFSSANDSIESKVAGLTMGGDDYISKPIHASELRARIDARLRYKNLLKDKQTLVEVNGIVLDLKAREVTVKHNDIDERVELTPIEFKILQKLTEDPGRSCDRDEILNSVWGQDVFVYPRSVDTHVSKLRKKLGEKGALISSVHGRGYRIKAS